MRTIATICARGGSTRLPRKNVRALLGRPLIEYTIEQALSCSGIDGVFVSTDDTEIARIAEKAGAIVPFRRPEYLSGSSVPKIPVIEHLVGALESSGIEISTVVDLDPTSPLRSLDDIRECIRLLSSEIDVVITGYPSEKNPYFNMVEIKEDGAVGLVKPGGEHWGGQNAPPVYSMNASIYVWRRDSLAKGLWGGHVSLYVMPRERSVDVDTEFDFRVVEMLMKERLRSDEESER